MDDSWMAKTQPLEWTRRFAGGLRADIHRRKPLYVSDWTDAFTAENRQITLASTCFLFFACIAPAIAFGALFDQETDGQLGAFEMVLSSALSGIVYAFFAGQPLCILGATGPELAYTVVFYNMCKSLDLEFLPARVWEGLWCALFTILLALFDGNAMMCVVTRFTEDVFSALISLIFIIEAFLSIGREFEKRDSAGALLTVLLALGTFLLAMYFRKLRNEKWLNPFLRNTIANFGVTISILAFTFISFGFPDVDIAKLKMPSTFEPTMTLSDGNARPWVVNPFGMERDFPVWGIFFSALPAVGLCILGYLDQNLTSLLINRPSSGLKKPPAYHLDLLVCGVFIYPVCGILGLPFTHAATIRSLTHLISLTTYEQKVLDDGTTIKVPAKVAEQRVTQLGIHVLIGLSAFASGALQKLPQAVLFGVFLFMGVSTIPGNDLFDRMSLWFIFDTSKYPAYPFLKGMSITKVHIYTAIQFACLVILYALKSIKEVAVVFPFFLIVIVIVRLYLGRIGFTKSELETLDGRGDAVEDPTAIANAGDTPAPPTTLVSSTKDGNGEPSTKDGNGEHSTKERDDEGAFDERAFDI